MNQENVWHEDDEFWDLFAASMFTPRKWEEAVEEVDHLARLLDLAPGAAVCDLACGPGRHSIALARQGYATTGVDRTASYLAAAGDKAQAEGLHVEFVQADMRTFRRPEAFDAVINMLTAFGYFEDPDDDRRVAENVHRSLRPGGAFLLDVAGKEWVARIFQPRDWSRLDDGTIFLAERKVLKNWSWMWNRWMLFKDGRWFEKELSHRIYSAVELETLLRQAGFARVDIYGHISGEPYDHQAKRLIAVARKAS